MQEVAATLQVNADQTVTVELAEGLPVGQYHVVLQLVPVATTNEMNQEAAHLSTTADKSSTATEQADNMMADAWEKWAEGVEQLSMTPQPVQSEYQQHLIEKFRAQGLDI